MTGREVGTEMGGRAFGGLLLAFVLSLALFPVPPAAEEMPAGPAADPHSHFQNPASCPRCHVSPGATPDPERFVPEADSFCLECHSLEALGATHPRHIRPADKAYAMKVPDDFRRDVEGRIFCLTCHNAHGPFLSPTRAHAAQKPANPDAPAGTNPAYRTYYMRRSDPGRGFVVLCEGCHGKQ